MPGALISFVADNVKTDVTEYTAACVVYMIAFATDDWERGGHSWTFAQSFDEDSGVCTVRGIQQATVYRGIERFRLNKSGVECTFDPRAAEVLGCRVLRISFVIDDQAWGELASTAAILFRDCQYFTREDE